MNVHFLAGLPRTGSTVLAAILNQNPALHVTSTSPLYHLLVKLNEGFNYCRIQHTFDHDRIADRAYRAVAEAFYGDELRTVFDKHRGWPKHVDAIQQYINPDAKIVATVRPIAEIITSYLRLIKKDPDNFVDKHLAELGCLTPKNEDRASLLWQFYLKEPYESLKLGLENHREHILPVGYLDLVFDPIDTLRNIYDFCELDWFNHRFDNLDESAHTESDDQWGLKDLHTIRRTLERRSSDPCDFLPAEAIRYFKQCDLEVCYA